MADGGTGAGLELGSAAWCARARELTADLPEQPGVGYRAVHVDADDARWHQVVEDGKVVAWAPGDLPDAEIELHWAAADLRALYRGERSGTDALDRLRVAEPGGALVHPPPLDISDTEEFEQLPVINDASLVAQYEFFDGPFGDVEYHMAWVDGRFTELALGRVDEPDVVVRIAYEKLVGVRQQTVTILEALEDGGKVAGDVGPLMLLAGMQESPGMQAAGLACSPCGQVLARIAMVASTSEHRAAMAALAAVTA